MEGKLNLAYVGTQISLTDQAKKNKLVNRILINDNNIEYNLNKDYIYDKRQISVGGTGNIYGNITNESVYYNVRVKGNTGIFIIDTNAKLVDKNKNVLSAELIESKDDNIYMVIEVRDEKSKTLIFTMKIPMDQIILDDYTDPTYQGIISGLKGTQTIYWNI